MTYPELNNAYDKTIADLQGQATAKIMARIAVEALTMIRGRVTEEGINADGQKFNAYSKKPILVGKSSFIQISSAQALLGSKPKRKKLEWRTIGTGANAKRLAILPGGYKELRERNQRRTDITNFSFTGRMWGNMGYGPKMAEVAIISNESDHAEGIAKIGPKSGEYMKILENLTNRFGEILMVSDEEIRGLERRYGIGTLEILKANKLA